MSVHQKKKPLEKTKCRYCGKEVVQDSANWQNYQPFCSEKCKLADLDCWFEGDYRIPGGSIEDEEDLPDGQSQI